MGRNVVMLVAADRASIEATEYAAVHQNVHVLWHIMPRLQAHGCTYISTQATCTALTASARHLVLQSALSTIYVLSTGDTSSAFQMCCLCRPTTVMITFT
jgi:hypothetical protein